MSLESRVCFPKGLVLEGGRWRQLWVLPCVAFINPRERYGGKKLLLALSAAAVADK